MFPQNWTARQSAPKQETASASSALLSVSGQSPYRGTLNTKMPHHMEISFTEGRQFLSRILIVLSSMRMCS
jgi:hypothetical protein